MTATALLFEAPMYFTKEDLVRIVAASRKLELRPRTWNEDKEPDTVFFSKPFGEFEVNYHVVTRMWEHCDPPQAVECLDTKPYSMQIGVRFDVGENGIFISPDMKGKQSCGVCGQPFNHKILKAILDENPGAHPIFHELVDEEFQIFVPWSEMGEDGMKSVPNLFNDFAKGNPRIHALAHDPLSPFNHSPLDHVFVSLTCQQALLADWKRELAELIRSLQS